MDARFARFRSSRRTRQRGVVLLVALIFLVLLTMLAIAASSGSLLQQRMVAATRSAQLARMSADTALRGAEWKLWSTASTVGATIVCGATAIDTASGCVKYDSASPLYAADGAVTRFRTGDNNWLSTGIEYTGANGDGFTSRSTTDGTASPNVAFNPRYIIEDLGLVKPPGAGPQHESGVTGSHAGASGGGSGVNIHIYRVTVRATGGTKNTVRVAESTFDSQTSN